MQTQKNKPDLRILLVPGAGGSGAKHWDHRWESKEGRVERVVQLDWDGGTRLDWTGALDAAIHSSSTPAILVAHSLGNILVAHWAAEHSGPVAGALLVAPADIEADWVPLSSVYKSFLPIPLKPLPFPTTLIASSDDVYLSVGRAREIAAAWGSDLRLVGPLGHIGSDSDLGDWEEGWSLLEELIKRIDRETKQFGCM